MRRHRRFCPINMNGCSLFLPFWAYNGGQTSLADYSGNNNTATVSGTVIKSSSPPQGWWFSGSDDYLSISDSTSMRGSGGDTTILAWVWKNADAGAIQVVHAWRQANNQSYLGMWLDETVRISFRIGTGQAARGTTTVVPAQKWTMIGGIRRTTTVYAIINGAREGTGGGPYSGSTNLGTSGVYEGVFSDGTSYDYTGAIGEIIVFDRSLEDEEIKSYYELTRSRYGV